MGSRGMPFARAGVPVQDWALYIGVVLNTSPRVCLSELFYRKYLWRSIGIIF